jgi:hypothetical protein
LRHEAFPLRFVSCADQAQNQQKRKERFDKRNESFRSAGRKALKSLWAPNQHFAELFVFNGLTAFSFRAVAASDCHARESGHPGRLSPRLGFPLARE